MIPNTFCLSQNNTFALSQNSTNSTSTASFVNKRGFAQQKIYRYLIEKGILCENGSLSLNCEHLLPSGLKEAQIKRLNKLLEAPFSVKSRNNSFEFSTTLKEVFTYLKIDNIEIVGGTVFYILGKEYMEELVQLLNIPKEYIDENFYADFEKPAADIDIRVSCTKPDAWKEAMFDFFISKLAKVSVEDIKEYAFIKYHTYKEPDGSQFSIVSFGNRSDFIVDLLFVKHLKRKNLFKHDAAKLTIDLKETVSSKLSTQPNHNLLESLILRLTKTLDAHEIDQIDLRGACMLFTYVTKGWISHSKELKETLIAKFLSEKDPTILAKIVKNHFPNDQLASLLFCYNLHALLSEQERYEVAPFVQELPVFDFQKMTASLQIFGILSSLTTQNSNIDIEISESHLYFKFYASRTLHLALEKDLTGAIHYFKENGHLVDPAILAIFEGLHTQESNFNLREIEQKETLFQSDPSQYLKEAFDLLELDEPNLKQQGFYLLASIGIYEGSGKHFPHLLTNFLALIQGEKSVSTRKNLFTFWLKYFLKLKTSNLHIHSKELENFYKAISNPDLKPDAILKSFCQNLSKIENVHLTAVIFEVWRNRPELFDGTASLTLVENFMKHAPRRALEILDALIEKMPLQKTRKLFEEILVSCLSKLDENPLIADVALKITEKMEKYNKPPKPEEVTPYIELAKWLLSVDFAKGMQLIKNLETKKTITKGLNEALKNTSLEQRLALVPHCNQNFATMNAQNIEEMLRLLVSCIHPTLDNSKLKWIGLEIFSFLKNIAIKGAQVSQDLKKIIEPKLEWVLLQPLSDYKENKQIIELLNSYFKIAETFNHQIIFKTGLVSLVCLNLAEILNADIKFVKDKLNSIRSKNGNMTSEELSLYQKLIEKALEKEQLDIAEEFLRKLLNHVREKANTPNPALVNLMNQLLKAYTAAKTTTNLQAFLELIEKQFPTLKIEGNANYWKLILIEFPDKNLQKKIELFLAKACAFLKDPEILLEVEKLVSLAQAVKGKEQEKYFKDALNLVEVYELKQDQVVTQICSNPLALKQKHLGKQAFSLFRKIGVSLLKLMPLIKGLALPEIYLEISNDKEALLECIEDKPFQEFIHQLALSILDLLKLKQPNYSKIYKAFSNLENVIHEHRIINIKERRDLVFKFVSGFVDGLHDVDIEDSFWTHFTWLLSRRESVEKTNELIALFAKAIVLSEKHSSKFAIDQDTKINLVQRIDRKTLPYLLEIVSKEHSYILFDAATECALKVIHNWSDEDNDIPTDRLLCKMAIEKFIVVCLKNKYYENLQNLATPELFSASEVFAFYGIISSALFKDSETIKSEKSIVLALEAYRLTLKSPFESSETDHQNLKSAVKHFIALLFSFGKNGNSTYSYIFLQELVGLSQGKDQYLKLVKALGVSENLPLFYNNENVVNILETMEMITSGNACLLKDILGGRLNSLANPKMMQDRLCGFLLLLSQEISIKILNFKEEAIPADLQLIAMQNFYHILFLFEFVPKSREENLQIALNYCYALTRLTGEYYRKSILYATKIVLKIVQETKSGGFLISTKKEHELIFKIAAITNTSASKCDSVNLTPKSKAELILQIIEVVMKPRTLLSYVIAAEYLELYSDLLKAGLNDEKQKVFDWFMVGFLDGFEKAFPDYATDSESVLKRLVQERKNGKF